ncbi:copper transporter [Tepidibacillus sp. LV47]|uniref:copper transporter n=1 Tax=Tepidibacillus sp. LV47 TaxID=3398228 RepID=UPI003AAD0C21
MTNRYYTTTIIAIFLSLSLGILIGGTLGQQWILQNQQKVVSYYQTEVRKLRETNKEYLQRQKRLETELEEEKEEIRELFQNSVINLIEGKRVLWIENQKEDEFKNLKEAVNIAGGINDQIKNDTTVFRTLTVQETKQNENPYDVIIYIPNEKEVLNLDDLSRISSTIPIIILVNSEKTMTKKMDSTGKMYYQSICNTSVNDQYKFLIFLKNLLEGYKDGK